MPAQIRAWLALRQSTGAFFGTEQFLRVADEMKGTGQVLAVDYNFDSVPFQNLSNRSAGQRLRRDMTDASSS